MTPLPAFAQSERSAWAGRWIALAVFGVALAVYTLGFLSLGRGPADAFSIAVSHVAPAAIACWVAWRMQPKVHSIASSAPRWLAHAALAVSFGLAWTAGLAGLTLVFAPEVLPRLLREVLYWTGATGALVYAAVAVTSWGVALRRRAVEREAAAARAELAALRARIEPHFLYNALESIAGLVRADPDAAEEAIARLGGAPRRLLDRGSGTEDPDGLVPLADEMATVRDTLFIERLRMDLRLTVIERIEEDALDCLVPPLTLQPLVENAVEHGLAPRPGGGTLSIAARVEPIADGRRLVLEVADDGVGAHEDVLAAAPGLGLDHLRRRLDAHYGEAARMDVVTTPERGFSVRLAMPARDT